MHHDFSELMKIAPADRLAILGDALAATLREYAAGGLVRSVTIRSDVSGWGLTPHGLPEAEPQPSNVICLAEQRKLKAVDRLRAKVIEVVERGLAEGAARGESFRETLRRLVVEQGGVPPA